MPAVILRSEKQLHSDIEEVATGSFLTRPESEIRGSGYVVKSLEAALWAFALSDDFESGALMAVNLGDDADTTGAIYGQIAGAYHGYSGIPDHWLDKIAFHSEIIDLADRLFALSEELA